MQNNKECKYTHEDLSAYFDGELNNKKMLQISTHIDECTECKKYIDNLEKTSNLLGTYIDGFMAHKKLDGLFDDIQKKIENKEHLKESSVDKIIEFPEKRANFINYIPSIIAIAAILLFSVMFFNKKSIFTNSNTSAKVNTTSVDSLEYSKFNAMIYKTKDDNKTVIWLFEEENDIDDSI